MPAISPTQVYDWASTSGEGSSVVSDTSNQPLQRHLETNYAVITDTVHNNARDRSTGGHGAAHQHLQRRHAANYALVTNAVHSEARDQSTGADDAAHQTERPIQTTRTPEYQQDLEADDFLPNPTPEEKVDILIDLKCAFISLLIARLFSFHFVYDCFENAQELVDSQLAVIPLTLPGLIYLMSDPVGTYYVLGRCVFRKTTSACLITCYLMYIRMMSESPGPLHYRQDMVTPKQVAAANMVHQILSLTIKIHGIVRHQESFATLLRFFVGKDDFIWAKLWYGFSVLCMVLCCVFCMDNYTGYYDPEHDNIWAFVYDDQMREALHWVRYLYFLALLLCVVSECFSVSQYLGVTEQDNMDLWKRRLHTAYSYMNSVQVKSMESKQTLYFLILAAPVIM